MGVRADKPETGLRPPSSSPSLRTSGTLDHLLDAADLAELMNVPERWVREHTRTGLIPHLRLGRYVRYRREAVLDWLDGQEQGGAAWRTHRPVPGSGTK